MLDVLTTAGFYGVNTVLMVGAVVILARLLGPAEFGLYAYALALINLLSVVARLGLPVVLVRETARAEALGDMARLSRLWRWTAVSGIVLAAGVTLATGAVLAIWPELIGAERSRVALIGLALVPMLALGTLSAGALRGLHRVPLATFAELLIRPVVFLAGIVAVILAAGSLDADRAILLNALGGGCVLVISVWLVWRHAPAGLRSGTSNTKADPAWLRDTFPLSLSALLLVSFEQSAILILGQFAPDREIGVFRIVQQVGLLATLAITPFYMVAAPLFSKYAAERDPARMQQVATAAARGATLLVLVLFVAVSFGGPWLLSTVFGAEFREGATALVIVLAGFLIGACGGPASDLLTMTGHERDHLGCLALGSVSGIGLCLLLAPEHGSLGAAIAVAVSVALYRLSATWRVWVRLGIDSSPLGLRRASRP